MYIFILEWLSSILETLERNQKTFMNEIRAEFQQMKQELISVMRNPQSISSDLDAQAINIIMPSQPTELPVDTAADFQDVDSKLKDDSALRAKQVKFYQPSIIYC